jgi:hypothetical protein
MRDNDWERPRSGRGSGISDAGMGAVRVALLFGSAAVALAMILTPLAIKQTENMMYASHPGALDMMSTGSIGGSSMGPGPVGQRAGSNYTVRRSVLQPSPNSVCVIRQNGMRTGDC